MGTLAILVPAEPRTTLPTHRPVELRRAFEHPDHRPRWTRGAGVSGGTGAREGWWKLEHGVEELRTRGLQHLLESIVVVSLRLLIVTPA
jgi:hypothetical protein